MRRFGQNGGGAFGVFARQQKLAQQQRRLRFARRRRNGAAQPLLGLFGLLQNVVGHRRRLQLRGGIFGILLRERRPLFIGFLRLLFVEQNLRQNHARLAFAGHELHGFAQVRQRVVELFLRQQRACEGELNRRVVGFARGDGAQMRNGFRGLF